MQRWRRQWSDFGLAGGSSLIFCDFHLSFVNCVRYMRHCYKHSVLISIASEPFYTFKGHSPKLLSRENAFSALASLHENCSHVARLQLDDLAVLEESILVVDFDGDIRPSVAIPVMCQPAVLFVIVVAVWQAECSSLGGH